MMPQDKAVALMLMLLSCCGFVCLGQEQPRSAGAATVQMKVERGMPFSAKVVTESTQVLADGNRIVRQSAALIARDSDGRTRREQKLVGTDASIIFIQDPVAGVSYVIDTQAGSVRMIPVRTLENVESPVNSAHDAESLGTQFIEGFFDELSTE